MKPLQLARLLGLSASALRERSEEFAEFLSLGAAGGNGAHRVYDDRDARVLAWITSLRLKNVAKREIHTMLISAQAEGWRNLPPLPGGFAGDEPIAVVPREAVEERVKGLEEQFRSEIAALKSRHGLELQALQKERDQLAAELVAAKGENAKLQERIIAINERLLTLVEQLSRK